MTLAQHVEGDESLVLRHPHVGELALPLLRVGHLADGAAEPLRPVAVLPVAAALAVAALADHDFLPACTGEAATLDLRVCAASAVRMLARWRLHPSAGRLFWASLLITGVTVAPFVLRVKP